MELSPIYDSDLHTVDQTYGQEEYKYNLNHECAR